MFFGVLNLTYHSPITIDSLTYRLGGDLYVSVLVQTHVIGSGLLQASASLITPSSSAALWGT